MKTKIIFFSASLLLSVGAIDIYNYVSREPPLKVYLRCPENKSGKISVTALHQNGRRGQTENFELVEACAVNRLEIEDYQYNDSAEFIFERENGEKHGIISNYGDNIQSDRGVQFAVILQITETPPFIANDNL